MKLLTKEILSKLPRVGSDDGEDPMIHVLCSTGHKTCYAPAAVMWRSAGITSETGRFPVAGLFSTEHNCDAPVG
jgi:hypothetical protein